MLCWSCLANLSPVGNSTSPSRPMTERSTSPSRRGQSEQESSAPPLPRAHPISGAAAATSPRPGVGSRRSRWAEQLPRRLRAALRCGHLALPLAASAVPGRVGARPPLLCPRCFQIGRCAASDALPPLCPDGSVRGLRCTVPTVPGGRCAASAAPGRVVARPPLSPDRSVRGLRCARTGRCAASSEPRRVGARPPLHPDGSVCDLGCAASTASGRVGMQPWLRSLYCVRTGRCVPLAARPPLRPDRSVRSLRVARSRRRQGRRSPAAPR